MHALATLVEPASGFFGVGGISQPRVSKNGTFFDNLAVVIKSPSGFFGNPGLTTRH